MGSGLYEVAIMIVGEHGMRETAWGGAVWPPLRRARLAQRLRVTDSATCKSEEAPTRAALTEARAESVAA